MSRSHCESCLPDPRGTWIHVYWPYLQEREWAPLQLLKRVPRPLADQYRRDCIRADTVPQFPGPRKYSPSICWDNLLAYNISHWSNYRGVSVEKSEWVASRVGAGKERGRRRRRGQEKRGTEVGSVHALSLASERLHGLMAGFYQRG